MRYLISLLFSLFIFSVGFSQGFESFDNFPETGTSYQSGDFTGDEGFTWHYEKARGDIEIDGKALTLGRNQSPAAELYSATISGGMGVLEFQYMQAFSSNVDLEVFVNDDLVYTATTNGEQNEIKDASVTVDVDGDIVLRFSNPSGAGQVAIDNLNWTGYEGGGGEVEYCENEALLPEPITHVEFAGIDNPSPNTTAAPGYEDFTSIHAEVETETEYVITLQGNTGGNYTNYFTVWIDWNQNGIFEEDEKTQAGTITNSTGDDGKTTSASIEVPADAVIGTTRMRIVKNYGVALSDPCEGFTFGQIEDYSVDVSEGGGGGEYTGDCYIKYNSSRIDGLGDLAEVILAADFPVEAGDVLDLYYLDFMLVGDVSGVEISVYEDSGNGPGAEILAPTLVTPLSQTPLGMSQVDSPLYDIRLDMSSFNLSLEGGEDGSKYWLAIQTTPGSFETNWWAYSCDIHNGTPFFGSVDEYGSWLNLADLGFNTDGAFSINCPADEPWEESCNYDCEDQFVDLEGTSSNLIVGGGVNQTLAFDIPVADNDFAFSGIDMNLYFNSGDGSDSTYDFTLYEDNNGEPGSVLDTWSVNGAEESVHVSGNFYRVTVNFPSVELEANTIYWMSVGSAAAAWQTIFYPPLNKPVAYINNNTEGEWVVQNSEDLVYALICDTEIPSTPSDECGPDYEAELEDGLGNLSSTVILASDFQVDPFISLNVNTVRLPLIESVESIEISFYEDDNGLPGTAVFMPTDVVPENQTLVAVNTFGDYIYEMELDMTAFALSLDGGAEGATYWMAITTVSDQDNYWTYSTGINNGTYFAASVDDYATWEDAADLGFPYDGAFSINCEGLPEIEEPGCEASVTYVEPITRVVMGEDLSNPAMPTILDNSSAPDSTDPVEDFTDISIDFVVGGPYEIGVEGNTDGPYMNYITAFVDLSDGEWSDYVTFEIGSIENSTGTDGQMAMGEISLNDYVSENGDYPMRVIKSYGSSPLDPCANYTFGQVENYMLTVTVDVPGDDFPEPYCDWEVILDVEPITYVQFAGIDNESDPTVNGSPALENFLDIEGTVEQGGTYEAGVNGNTNGNYDSYFAIYIDWNQNDSFDDPGEEYQIGMITNSDGTGGPILFDDIVVPEDALLGQTRMRVVKSFDPINDACEGAWWGQAEDYTINVTEGDGGGENPEDCDQGDVSNPAGVDQAYGITIGNFFEVADDFFVTGSNLNIKTIKLNLLAEDLIDQVDIAFYENDGGFPGALLPQSVSEVITADQQIIVGGAAGYDLYEVYINVDLDFPTGEYWLAPQASSLSAGMVYWEQTAIGSLGEFTAVRNNAAGEEWEVNDEFTQSVFTLYCEEQEVPEQPDLPCNFGITFSVEPITHVVFAGIDNTSSAVVDASPGLEDFTDIEGNVEAGGTYEMALEGNTDGAWDNYFTAFIKWNEGSSWTDYSTFEIGSIFNSTGTDGKQAINDVTIPADAAAGSYTMRIIKNFGESPLDPCGAYMFGQAEDYTIVVGDGGGDECWQGIPSVATVPMAFGITIGTEFRVAEDFTVPEGTTFTVEQLTFDINNTEVPDLAIINLREDNGGQPGTILHTIEMAPSSWEEVGEAFGEPIYNVVFDLANPIEFGEGVYWIDPKMSIPSEGSVWWAATDEHSDGAFPMFSGDDGTTWVLDPSQESMVFTISGHCETLGLGDVSSFDFSYYPNPVSDVLYINSSKKVENLRVFNLTGQEIVSGSKVSNGQVDVNALPTGVYVFRVMLEGGQVETFKIIKK